MNSFKLIDTNRLFIFLSQYFLHSTLEQRMEMLKALQCVDIVLPYHELDYISVCKEVKADIFVIGEDWGRKPHNQGVEQYLESEGKKIVQVQYHPRTSSTKIKKTVISLNNTGLRD